MANNPIKYKFWIDAYSPMTMPMARLGEYMAELGHLMANEASVHFRELEEGSTVVAVDVEFEAYPKVRNRLHAARTADDKDAVQIFNRLNKMLRDDNAVGCILTEENQHLAEVLHFPGREIPAPQVIGPFTEPATIKAKLFRIGGRDQTAHAQLIDSTGRIWNGTLTQQQAAEMAAADGGGLYQWFLVSGTARWIRTEEESWDLKGFSITDFRLLPESSLKQEIEALRNIEGSEWGGIDPSVFIEKLRRDDDEIH